MKSRRRRPGGTNETASSPIQFRLDAQEERVTTEDGHDITGRGYVICDPNTGTPLGEDDFFFKIGGGLVCDVVGTEPHLEELQSGAFRPGRSVAVVRTDAADGDHDRPVLEVRDPAGSAVIGTLPAEIAETIAFYGTESYESALCLWEWRNPEGRRLGVRLLLAPGWSTEAIG